MNTITVYSPKELKDINEEGYRRALEKWGSSQDDIPWLDEIMESLEAVFKASGVSLRDYSIGPYDYNIRFDMEEATGELTGERAIAWLENNLLSDLRVKYGLKDIKRRVKYGYKVGTIEPCPLTGVCFDDDYLESLVKSIRSGDTLREAYKNLAWVASKAMESEYEYQTSEENFLDQDHLQYTEEGRLI